MDKSYKMTIVKDTTTGVPNAVANVEEVGMVSGAIDQVLNIDNNVVFSGPVKLVGRVVDAALGAMAEHRIKNGYFATPFVKIGG